MNKVIEKEFFIAMKLYEFASSLIIAKGETELGGTNLGDVTTTNKRDNDDAFVISINEYKLKLYRMAYAYLGNEQDALEAVQETTCRAFVNFRKLKEANHFGTWIMRILMNYCIDEQRRRKRNLPLPEEPQGSDTLDDGNLVLRQALTQLEPKQRQVVFLKYFGG
jgi:RNA polymerase sigma factor (sigma-70 family)